MKRFIILCGLLLLFSSCAKDAVEKGGELLAEGDFLLSVSAELPEMPVINSNEWDDETRAYTQYTVRINWTAGDKISVVNLTTGKQLGGSLTAQSSGNSTSFSGSLKGTVTTGDRLAYFYPSQECQEESDFVGFQVDMSSQMGTMNDVPLCVYCVATADENSFQDAHLPFEFLMCYMMVALSDIPASAQIKSLTITNVANRLSITANGDNTGLSFSSTQGNIVLTPNRTASSSGVRMVYVAIPQSGAATRRIILETPVTSFDAAFGSSAISNGYAYNTNTPGFLQDDLSFEDYLVREYCLGCFDSNHDGKLSLVEIAGVTRFPSTAIPQGVLSFEELGLFYGLESMPSLSNLTGLTSVAVPKQITALQDQLFQGCSSLVEIHMNPTTPPSLGSNVFSGLPDNYMIIVPDDSLQAYLASEDWAPYSEHIFPVSSANGNNIRITTEGGAMGTASVGVDVN